MIIHAYEEYNVCFSIQQLKPVEKFKYLGSVIGENVGCEEEVRHRVEAGTGKLRKVSGMVALCATRGCPLCS